MSFSHKLHLNAVLVLTVFLAVSTSAFATRYPLRVQDVRGKTVAIVREPTRIVSTVPSNTEILYALGLESHIAGVGSWDDYPPQVKKKPRVGDHAMSVERIIALRPDLVVAHATLNDSIIPSLEKYGIRVVAIDPETIQQVEQDILLLGKITNREKQSMVVSGKIASARQMVTKKISRIKSRPRVLFAVQSEPLWAAGPHTFIDEMIRMAGGVNVASSARSGFSPFSTEAAVYRHPEIIIGTDKGSRKIFTRGFWKNTPAAKSGRVYEASPDPLVRAGPRLAEGMMSLAKLVHPEAFR
ncbi:MAG TPA: ABC transporter substrate-binding protein [Armatimonadota bacterium]|jgi:iron complex transport system substrate-binding protein